MAASRRTTKSKKKSTPETKEGALYNVDDFDEESSESSYYRNQLMESGTENIPDFYDTAIRTTKHTRVFFLPGNHAQLESVLNDPNNTIIDKQVVACPKEGCFMVYTEYETIEDGEF